jgi:hypothetical protein
MHLEEVVVGAAWEVEGRHDLDLRGQGLTPLAVAYQNASVAVKQPSSDIRLQWWR